MAATSEALSRGDTPDTLNQLSPGITIKVRDGYWLVAHVTKSSDGFKIKAHGISDYARDTAAAFYTALDHDLEVFDPAEVTIEPDNPPRFRCSHLWLESTIRQTPVPLYQNNLEVSIRMLVGPPDYQLNAVRRALSPEHIRPRILLTDAIGLDKTLEVGMIVAGLIHRGHGERILIVIPKHILEQFQQEIRTHFTVPLVHLDSHGIQEVRQKLPTSRSPFFYFPHAIISIDTLKSAEYRAQLEKVSWGIVIIGEIHNATNSDTQNNDLARMLTPRAEALILALATSHSGSPKSFKEVPKLLDPLAVRPGGSVDMGLAKKLTIRRHRSSPEVKPVADAK